MSAPVTKALADIFESPSDEEEFLGFGVDSLEEVSEESRDSLQSQASWKPALHFRSKFITDELAHIFMDTDSEEEFEGFSNEESSLCSNWTSPKVWESEDDSDDIGFYSDDENPAPKRRQSSGLCVAFRFPARRSSAHDRPAPEKFSRTAKTGVPPTSTEPAVRYRKRRGGQAHAPVASKKEKTDKRFVRASNESEEEEEEEEDELTEADMQAMNRRAQNIQENKAMLAKLFADLSSISELSPKTTPSKRKQNTPKKHVSSAQSERRNPSRKARPPEHFGLEQDISIKPKEKTIVVDIKKLMEVDFDLREKTPRKKQRCRKRASIRMPEDITEEDLDNVADRAKDKILDKENGSTCHQCRQKTLDTKTECRNPYCGGVKGQFCGPCLRNRYGEDVRSALLDPTWECPICRGVCNCSLCRKRDGRCATGSLSHLAKFYGYGSVQEYLESIQKTL
ncbi:cell division cycle-associated 7-like protein [Hoplias malabaricus]|uniref:cell division cycle-associated 7-like protein n=1 Tax=Hoplias malabaricus TaxID=27720 RepID=UPI0034621DFD